MRQIVTKLTGVKSLLGFFGLICVFLSSVKSTAQNKLLRRMCRKVTLDKQ